MWRSNRYGKEGVRGTTWWNFTKIPNMSSFFPHHDLSRDSEVEWCWCLRSIAFQPFHVVSVPAWNYCFYCVNQVNTLNSIGHLPYSYPFSFFWIITNYYEINVVYCYTHTCLLINIARLLYHLLNWSLIIKECNTCKWSCSSFAIPPHPFSASGSTVQRILWKSVMTYL